MPSDRDDYGPIVRPYALTRGRTRPVHEHALQVETLVSTTSAGASIMARLDLEHRRIVALCQRVLSVAEISARLHLTLGVTRVLVGDMVQEGLVSVHRSVDPDDGPDLNLLEKVLHGLQKR
jgi:hypothetical protein